MSLVVGFDIGTRTLTAAVFSGGPKKFRLVDFIVEEVQSLQSGSQDADGDFQAPLSTEELIEKIVRERNLTGADFVASVDTKDCVVREIVVPFTRDDQIRKTVQFEAEGYFTGLDLEDAVLEFIKVGEGDGKSHLVVMALRHEAIERRLGHFKRSGVDPVALDLDAAALFNAFALTPTYDPKRTVLLIDMGATSVKILLVENGVLKKVRALRLETAIARPDRLIPQPAAVEAGGPRVAVEVVGGEREGLAAFEEYSIEARFREIERALKLLDPSGIGDGGDGGEAALQGAVEEGAAPIAILSDEDFARIEAAGDEDLSELGPSSASASADNGSRRASGARTAADEARGGEWTGRQFPGSGGPDQGPDYRGYLERVALEVQRSLASVPLRSPVDLICLTGGMSGRDETCRFFAAEFDVETVQLDFGAPGESFESDLDSEDTERVSQLGAVAVGLALKQLQRDRVGVDFRKGRFRYEHRFERLRYPVLVSSILFFAFFLQATYWKFHEWKLEKARLEGYQQKSASIYQAFFEKPLAAGRRPFDAASSQVKAWQGKGTGDIGRYLDIASVATDFSKVLRESRLTFRLDELDLNLQLTPAKRSSGGAQRSASAGPAYSAERSKAILEAQEAGAYAKLERLFRGAGSEFFSVRGSERQVSDGWTRIDLDLTLKDEKLKAIEREEAQ
jgi:hypothetical protein